MKKTKKRGVTLVELIMAMVLMAMVGIIVTIIFNTAFSSRELIEREVSIQSDMRNSMQTLNQKVEQATGIFVLDDSKYKPVAPPVGDETFVTNFVGTAGWNYIGLSDDGTKLMLHTYKAETDGWISTVIGSSSFYKMTLNLTFTLEVEPGSAASDYQDNRLLKYDLSGKYDKGTNLSLDTAIMALNTKQIFSRVAKGKEGIALAYRNDPIIGNTNAAITFVFDISGSMEDNLNGRYVGATHPDSRLSKLKVEAKKMMQLLTEPESVSVNLVTFSTRANYIKDGSFTRLTSKTLETVEKDIDSMNVAGATNPGDGLRYGLAALKEQAAQNKYVVILSDGLPNRYTITSSGRSDLSSPLSGEKNSIEGGTNGSVLYVRDVAKAWGKASGAKNLYFIGFSGVASEKALGQTMTNHINENGLPSQYEDAATPEQLNATFKKIVDQVVQDLWFVNGP